MIDQESVNRPKTCQPCVYAPPPYSKPVVPVVTTKLPRRRQVNRSPEHGIKLAGVMRRTQTPNAPGTNMKACRPGYTPAIASAYQAAMG